MRKKLARAQKRAGSGGMEQRKMGPRTGRQESGLQPFPEKLANV